MREKGITLIALVVTIVVLLILAGVSISMLTGENGIINQATSAKEATEQAKVQEIVDLAVESLITKYKGDTSQITPNLVVEEIKEKENRTDISTEDTTFPATIIFEKEGREAQAKLSSNAININLGNFLVNGETYCDTLQEAVSLAQPNDAIMVLKDISDLSENVVIDKNITIDTNGKTLTFDENSKITINESQNVVIKGNGTITSTTPNTFILNYGNLETNRVTIRANATGYIASTIVVLSPGKIVSNNSNIKGISCEGDSQSETGNVIINGGEYEDLAGYPNGSPGTFIINDGIINSISLGKGGTCIIKGGSVNKIALSNDSADIYLTIGDIDKDVNTNSPEIEDIEVISDLTTIKTIFNFYNGNIKNCFLNLEDGTVPGGFGVSEYNIRPGYRAETTSNGTILVKE